VSNHPFNERDVRNLYRFLAFSPTRLAEVRCIDMQGGGVVSRELVSSGDDFVRWSREFNGRGNCFVGRNARTEKANNVTQITAMSLDIDPVRPKGQAATPEQVEESVNAGRLILDKFPDGGALGSSGNGALVIWTVDAPGVKDLAAFPEKLRQFQVECQKLFDEGRIKVDATQDTPRLIKLLGTVSVKGDTRLTRLLRLPNPSRDGSAVFGYVEQFCSPKPVAKEILLDKSVSQDRSKNDYALAIHYKNQGLGPGDVLEALKHHALGRPDRSDDHERIVRKLFGGVGEGVGSGVSRPGGDDAGPSVVQVHSPSAVSVSSYLEGLNERGKVQSPELPTGFREFDMATHGIRRGDVYTIAARPGIGKTSILINIAVTLCAAGKSVLFLSTEMSYQDIWDRAISSGAPIDGGAFRTGQFSAEDKAKMGVFLEQFKTFRFNVCDSFQPKIEQVGASVAQYKPDVLIFDHVQHIDGGEDWKTISVFVQGLKRLAMQHKMAVLVASQLRRPPQSMNYKTGSVKIAKPTLSDLKGCGKIEEEAAFVLLLSPTDTVYSENCPVVRADLAKNRYGPNIISDLVFFKNITKFRSLEEVNAI
jgi:KaiC/GvpD/RAD55 family RecA-like ATPase